MIYDVIYHFSCLRSLIDSFKERSYAEKEIVKQIKNQKQSIKRHLIAYFVNMTLSKLAAQVHQKNVSNLDIS